jgi:hypothetical protein
MKNTATFGENLAKLPEILFSIIFPLITQPPF